MKIFCKVLYLILWDQTTEIHNNCLKKIITKLFKFHIFNLKNGNIFSSIKAYEN